MNFILIDEENMTLKLSSLNSLNVRARMSVCAPAVHYGTAAISGRLLFVFLSSAPFIEVVF